jgi:hypothetical protein
MHTVKLYAISIAILIAILAQNRRVQFWARIAMIAIPGHNEQLRAPLASLEQSGTSIERGSILAQCIA